MSGRWLLWLLQSEGCTVTEYRLTVKQLREDLEGEPDDAIVLVDGRTAEEEPCESGGRVPDWGPVKAGVPTDVEHAPICPWCDRQGWDICQHFVDTRECGPL